MNNKRRDLPWTEKLRIAREVVEKKRAENKARLESFHKSWFYKVMVPLRFFLLAFFALAVFSPDIPMFDTYDVVTDTQEHEYSSGGRFNTRRHLGLYVYFQKSFYVHINIDHIPSTCFVKGDPAVIHRNIFYKKISVSSPKMGYRYYTDGGRSLWFYFIIAVFCLLLTFIYRDADSIVFNQVVTISSFTLAVVYQFFA